jgi:hypothetical protein
MATKTRYFVIASLLVLAVGLGTGWLAYYLEYPTSAFSRDGGPDELRLIPAEASLVAYADVHAVMASPLREKMRRFLPGNHNRREEFTEQTGIHVDTDIDYVVVAFTSTQGEKGQASGARLVLARGRFDAGKIEALMRDHGGRVEDYKGKRVIAAETPQENRSVSLAFLEPGLIAVGSADMVHSAVDLTGGGASVTSNEAVMHLVRDLDAGNVWAVGRFDALASQAALPAGVSEQLPAIQWFSASAHVDTGVRGIIKADARDEEAATGLRDVIRGVMALVKLQASRRPELDMLLRGLELGGAGKTVALTFDLPSELFDLLETHAPSAPQ